jgi:hypothetical protein
VVIVALISAACCCCGPSDFEEFIPVVSETSTPAPTPVIVREVPGDLGAETELLLETTVVPVNPSGSPDYSVGTRRLFHASNVDTDENFDLYAILEYKTDHVYMWVEEGVPFDRDDLVAAADLFEEHTYVTNQTFFGAEWSPGVDNDPHLSILHARGLGSSVAGYYSSANEFVTAVRKDSNEMEMFFISIENVNVGDAFYSGVLAHEFQHMIHWYHDRNEETWLNEGFSELAAYLNGFDVGSLDWAFAREPDLQLNSWPEGPGTAGPNYGAAYLFTSYFLDRFGSDATQALVAHQENSFASVDAVLEEQNTGLIHEDIFGDWVAANLLDDPAIDDGRYGYEDIDPATVSIGYEYDRGDYPVSESATVHQYATDYIDLRGSQPLVFRFTGSTQVGLADVAAHSGRYVWWSNRGDDSDMTVTRAFDLSDASNATLEFWAWYDIEEDWDYAYLEISVDGGQTWEIITTPSCTTSDPNGNSFGCGYTGRSGGGGSPAWIQEQVDLSAYAGQEVLIRFEYITDDAVNLPGFVLDDVAIPEVGYSSDFEDGDDGWEAAGFMRHANVLSQRWLVQMILFGPETTVQRLELGEDWTGEWVVPLDSSTSRAVITISGLASVTTEVASYSYEVEAE